MNQDNLSPTKRAALSLLDTFKDIIVMNCDDETIQKTMVNCHPSSFGEYIKPSDYMNAEDAMQELGLGYNRNKFFNLLKKYNVETNVINGHSIGYHKEDIERIRKKTK
jgi:hypothetical protein